MKQVRKALVELRQYGEAVPGDLVQNLLDAGWASLAQAHRCLAEIPRASADDEVQNRMIAVGKYATSLLVRLRRLSRNPGAVAQLTDDDPDAEVPSRP